MGVPRCINTQVAIPECSCRKCGLALIDRYAPEIRRAGPTLSTSSSSASGDPAAPRRARPALAARRGIGMPTTALALPRGNQDAA